MKKLTYLALVALLLPFVAQAKNWADVPTNDNTLIVQVDKDSIQKSITMVEMWLVAGSGQPQRQLGITKNM